MRTVRDIMATDVVTIARTATVRELVDIMSTREISGLPVIDETRKVVGVVSQTDVVSMVGRAGESPTPDSYWELTSPDDDGEWPGSYFLGGELWGITSLPAMTESWQDVLEEATVEEIMTPAAYSVDAAMTIWEAARFMVDGRIHRVLVLDDGKLVGLVSSFDILRVVAGDEGG